MGQKFTKKEDRAIIDAYVRNGFHLTAKAIGEASEETGRTPNAIRNRMSRYLFPQYPMTLNKDIYIRILLMEEFAKLKAQKDTESYQEILMNASRVYKLDYKKFVEDFEKGNNDIWSKVALQKNHEKLPNTMEQFVVRYISKEDERYHILSDLTMEFCTQKEERKSKNWFRKCVNWIKGLFK